MYRINLKSKHIKLFRFIISLLHSLNKRNISSTRLPFNVTTKMPENTKAT